MVIGNGELMAERFPTLAHGNSKNEIRQRNIRRQAEKSERERSPKPPIARACHHFGH